MAASKPTFWLSAAIPHPSIHSVRIGDLSRRSGLFPSRPRSLSPAVWLPRWNTRYSEFDSYWYPGRDPRAISALPPCAIARG